MDEQAHGQPVNQLQPAHRSLRSSETGAGVGFPFRLLDTLAAGVVAALILITCAVVYIPFAPFFPADKLDSGWQFAVNMAVAKGLVFGRDIIFTFGPYGSIFFRQYNPSTSVMMFGGCALMAAASGLLLLCLCEGYSRLIALALASFMLLVPIDTQLFAVPLLALMLIHRVALQNVSGSSAGARPLVKFTLALTLLAIGLLSLVKGTFGFCADIVMFFACLLLLRRRRFGLAVAAVVVFIGSIAVFWIAAGQPIQFLPEFFFAQIPIVSGYTDAMALAGPAWQIVVFLVICALLWVSGNLRLQTEGDAGLALAAGSAMILFLTFKEGLVRADHATIAGGMLGLSGIAFFLVRKTPLTVLGCLAGLIGFVTINDIPVAVAPIAGQIEAQFKADGASIHSQIKDPKFLDTTLNASLSAIRAAQFLPPISGTTDIYPVGQSVLLANGLDWDPRPILQSYSAYTPALAAADARHLAGPGAPANILFEVQPIDHRLAALEDGLSWPALLADYQVTGLYGDLALLQRRPRPAPILISPLLSGTYQTGVLIKLPANAPFIWAELDIRRSLLGRLFGVIFKPPQLQIQYLFADGRHRELRYIAGMGQAGFLLAPFVQSTRDFAALSLPNAKGYASQAEPSAIRLTAQYGGGLFWRRNFSLKMLAIAFPVQPLVGRYLFTPLQPVMAGLAPEPPTAACAIDGINGRLIDQVPVDVQGFLHVTGWAAISTDAGVPAAQTTVTLIAPDGSRKSALAIQTPRRDVAKIFKRPALWNCGFDLQTELTGMSGNYTLTINPSSGGKTWSCSNQLGIRVLEPTPAGTGPKTPN